MDPQAITLVVSMLGFAVAALGLLLAWYRRPDAAGERWTPPGWLRRAVPTRGRLALLMAAVIAVLTVGGILSSAFVRTSTSVASGAAPLSESQYRSNLSRACLAATDEAGRILESEPQGSVFGINAVVERRVVDALRVMVPPDSLRSVHDELLAAWDRRVVLLESLYPRLDRGDATAMDDLQVAADMATTISEVTTSLGVGECAF